MIRVKLRFTNIDFLAKVLDNFDKDPNRTVLYVLPYSYSKNIVKDALLEKILIVYKDES